MDAVAHARKGRNMTGLGQAPRRRFAAAHAGACLAWSLVLGLGCGGAKDGDGGGRDRSGPNAPPPPAASGTSGGSGQGGSSANAGSGADFGNGASMPTTIIGGALRDAGVNETTSPDDVKCGGAKFTPKITMTQIPGNILLIADKSGSMNDPFPATGNPKWQDARTAVANAIDSIKDLVNVGTVFFPDTAGCTSSGGFDNTCSCNVPPFTSTPPQIAFTPGSAWVPMWNSAFVPIQMGNTPLSEALQAADKALADNLPKLQGTTIVVVVTDGAPNCVLDRMPLDAQLGILTPLPMKWLGMGVKTYVIGLPGADTSDAVTILDGVANAGGTTKNIPATDPATVQSELQKIIGLSVTSNFETCTIPLDKKPPNPDDVNLVVTKDGMDLAVDRDLGNAGGWAMDQDAKNIVLQGNLCDNARAGAYSNITVVFGCVDVPPLPPPPPVM
jgi:hypothetical protein